MNVFLQPAARSRNPQVRRNYKRTICEGVDLDKHANQLDSAVFADLKRLFPSALVPMWGITPGAQHRRSRNDSPVTVYKSMRPGDTVFFTGDGKLYLGGTIAHTWEAEELAAALWGVDEESGQTWQHMYAISSVRGFEIPMHQVRTVLGWKNEHRHVRKLERCDPVLGEDLKDMLNIEPGLAASHSEVNHAAESTLKPLPRKLEREYLRAVRAEQTQLRAELLPNPTGICALCGRELPRDLLVAAHIKKRSQCTDEERRDRAVVMPACRLGCDELYERGLIAVAPDGRVEVSPQIQNWPTVTEHIEAYLTNKTITWHTNIRVDYFAWHRSHTFRDDVKQ